MMNEELIKLLMLKEKYTGLDVFKEFDNAFKEMDIHLEEFVTTEGASNILGKNICLIQQLKQNIRQTFSG